MTEKTAYTVRNDFDEVRELGTEVVKREDEPASFKGGT
jgi:uncharacterized protein (DUF1786 family)